MPDKSNDEIDLFNLVGRFVLVLKKYAVLIVICVLIATGTSLGLYFAAKKVYESRMMIFSDILTESYAEKLAVTIQSLLWDGNHELVGKRLGITTEQAGLVKSIKVESALDEGAANVQESDKLFLVVTVRVQDNSVLPDLQNGILNYVRQNEFAKVREEQKRIFLTDLIQKVEEEITKIESLKERISEGNYRGSEGMVMMDPSNPYAKTVELYREKLTYESELALLNSVQLVEGFTPFANPIQPKLSVYVPAGFFAGVLLAFGIILLRYVSKVTVE
jgi:hypothetical protein